MLHLPKNKIVSAVLYAVKVAPILRKECDTPFKEAQLQSIWKGTPLN